MDYNKNNIIMSFKYNKKEYVVLLNNNKIEYGYLENEQINFELTEEENNLLKLIYKNLTINKQTSVDCGIFKIKGKKIKIYYDLTSKLYFFYEYINNELKIPSKEVLAFLNSYYNNQERYVFSNEERLDDAPELAHIKRIVKVGKTFVSILVSATIAFQFLPSDVKTIGQLGSDYYLNRPTLEQEINEDKYSFKEITKSIQTNENLTKEEKQYILNIENQYEENQDYINQESVYKKMNYIDITYKEGEFKNFRGNAEALYDFITNSICIFNMPNSDKSNFKYSNKNTVFHEVNHALSDFELSTRIESYYLTEMVNELYTYEYYEDFSEEDYHLSYEKFMQVMYPLCEILDEKTIRSFKYSDKLAYIIDNLMEIDPDIGKACRLITAINSIPLYNRISSLTNLEIFEDNNSLYKYAMDEKTENYLDIYNIIKHYYNKKYDKNMTEDQIMMLYFHQMGIPEATEKVYSTYSKINPGIRIDEIKPKGYISKKYKENHPNVEIKYHINMTNYTGIIEEKNRYTGIITVTSEETLENNHSFEYIYNEDGSFSGIEIVMDEDKTSNHKAR